MNSLYYQKRLSRNIGDKFFSSLSVICALIPILPLILVVTYILIKGGSQINLEKAPPLEYSARYIPPPTPTGMAIIEAMVVIINVPINAGLIPPASKSSPGGFGSKVNSSGVI